MAMIRPTHRMGARNFAHKSCNPCLLRRQNKKDVSAAKTSSLSMVVLLGDIKTSGLYGVVMAADKVTPQDCHTRTIPVCRNCINAGGNYNYLSLNKEHSLPQCLGFTKLRRTFCTTRAASRLQTPQSQSLCRRRGQLVFNRAYTGNGTRSEPLYKTKTGYYEILEVTPTASQAQIKTAYYKQSFINHPDRNAGGGMATVRFFEINEAYTVLGNKALRRKYDRGMLALSDLAGTARPTGRDTAKRDATSRSVMAADGRGGLDDFDQFFKAHYNEQLRRDQDSRARKEETLKKEQETIEEMKLGSVMEMAVGVMVVTAVALLLSLKQR